MESLKYDALIRQLEEANKRAEHWKQISKKTGLLRLREAENLSLVIQAQKETKALLEEEIAERIRAEEKIEQSESRFRANFESAPVGMAIIDAKRRFTEVNAQMCSILGYDLNEMTGRSFNAFIHPKDQEADQQEWRQLLAGKLDFNHASKRLVHKDGTTIWCLTGNALIRGKRGKPLYFLSHLLDITDRKKAREERARLQSQIQHEQKTKAIGTLAGGIAHDFNNIMMGIQGRASLMMMDLEPSHPHYEHIKSIEDQIQSATGLTRQLLGFARGGKYEVRPINLNELVKTSSEMFGRTRKEIQIHTRFQKPIPGVEADQSQIEQVLLNMYVNAWQAMPEGGRLYLETKNVAIDDDDRNPHPVKKGSYVNISITDTGVGMDENTRQLIFDPFFTTKEKNRGTGLGLASAYGIVKNHGGFITVHSEKGHGTTFNIYLPASEKKTVHKSPKKGMLKKGSGTILLVDDEDYIINVGQSLLKILGYTVKVAGRGKEAVEIVSEMGTRIDLVILDMIMPEMNGSETFDRIRKIHPEMAVLLSSGYAKTGQADEIMARGCNGFIQKPFTLSTLSDKVSMIMDNIPS